jgi:hypothetical protein
MSCVNPLQPQHGPRGEEKAEEKEEEEEKEEGGGGLPEGLRTCTCPPAPAVTMSLLKMEG